MGNSLDAADTQQLEILTRQCQSFGYPGALTESIVAYLRGGGSLSAVDDAWQATGTHPTPWGFLTYRNNARRLTLLQRRQADLARITGNLSVYLHSIATSGPLEDACAYLLNDGVSEEQLLDWCLEIGQFAHPASAAADAGDDNDGEEQDTDEDDENWDDSGPYIPTPLGRFLLTYVPDRFDDLLHPLQLAGRDYALLQLLTLLTVADPPQLDLAWDVAQQLAPRWHGQAAVLLLRGDVARFAPWARTLLTLPLSLGGDACWKVLHALFTLAPDAHCDLALRAARGGFPDLSWWGPRIRRLGLTTLHRHDSDAVQPLLDEALLSEESGVAAHAVKLIGSQPSAAQREALRRCVARGPVDAALRAVHVLLDGGGADHSIYAASLLGHRSKRLRDMVAAWLCDQGSAVCDDVAPLLAAPTAEARASAVRVLHATDAAHARPLLEALRTRERSQQVRLELDLALGPAGAPDTPPSARVAALTTEATEALQRVAHPVPAWVKPELLAPLCWAGGAPLPLPVAQYLFYCQMRVKEVRLDARVRQALDLLDARSSAEVARALYDAWSKAGAPAADSALLPLLITLADDRIAAVIALHIPKLAKGARAALAAKLVRALALRDDPAALTEVAAIARDFKPGRVRAAAREAYAAAARRRGITRTALDDAIVPRLGFDASGGRTLSYGGRSFTARLAAHLDLQLWSADGELLAALPRATRQDDAARVALARDEWRTLQRQVARLGEAQAARLEQACSTRRAWDAERWRALFLDHPLLRSLATGLVWSAQASAGLPALLFRVREDGTPVDVTDQPVALPAQGQVLLAHPLELPPDALAAWREHFTDRDLAQPFAQLDRPTLQPAEAERGARWWTLYEGYVVKASELRRSAQHAGWEIDDPKDGGHSVIWKLFPATGVEAVLETEFVWSGAERYVSTPLIRLGFLPLGAVRHGPELDGDNPDGAPSLARGSQSQLRALGEVPPIAFSEAATDVAAFARLGAYDPAWRTHTAV